MAEASFYVGPDDSPDKYRLRRQVGSGGEAQLWEAEIDVSDTWELVAVKILRTDHFADLDRWKDRWAEQAEVLRFIRHPGVVGVREHFEGGGIHYAGEAAPLPRALYLTMNWVEGQTLRDWVMLHRSPADGYEALRFLAQVADVLDWLHSGQATPSRRPVIHADVTPNNVLVTPAGQAVIVDFGLTRLAAGRSAVVEGTEGYVAPELAETGAYSPASDRYAFGALAYFVLTGVAAPTELRDIRAGLASVPAVAAQPGVVDQLMRMFDRDPALRPSCGEWIRFFKVTGATSVGTGLLGTAPMGPPGDLQSTSGLLPAPAEPPRRRRRRGLVVALIVLAALLAGGIAYAASRHSGSSQVSVSTTTATTGQTATTTGSTPATTTTTLTSTTTPSGSTTTTQQTTTTSTPRTTTTVTTPTTASSLTKPLATDAFTYGNGCGFYQVNVRNAPMSAALCSFDARGRTDEYSLDINLPQRVTHLAGRLVFADETFPAETTGFVKVLEDATKVQEGGMSFASPYVLDLDVTGVSRVSLRFSIPAESQDKLRKATFVLVDASVAT